ncbi:MAG TPA: alanine--glyoxylate aminotransferase family protein [Firmicutes bacterium]|nr:alanine--glyoxylate aminotransferase family protein [Bacillota bacterium]
MFEEKADLFIPGPTPIPPRVMRAMSRPMINHRGPEFHKMLAEVTEKSRQLLKTSGDAIILTSSGTGGMEAAVSCLLSPGDRALVSVSGVFGERYAKILEAYGIETVRIPSEEPGKPVEPHRFQEELDRKDKKPARAVFITQNETSTGVRNDVRTIARIAKDHGALVIVDAISSFAAMELPMDEWGIDIVIAASQKALMTPPGLAIVGVSNDAWKAMESSSLPRFYFDLRQAKRSAAKGETPSTPAVSLLFGLNEALTMILDEGPVNFVAHHTRLSQIARTAMRALGFELLASDEWASTTVTAVKAMDGMNADEFRRRARKYEVVLAGGQGELSGKIFRLAHLGYISQMDMLKAVSAIELALRDLGYPVKLGMGVAAAEALIS